MGIWETFRIVSIAVIGLMPQTCIQTFFYHKTLGLKQQYRGLRLVLVMVFLTLIEVLLSLNPSLLSVSMTVLVVILYPVFFMGDKVKDRFLYGVVNCAIYLVSGFIGLIIASPESWVDFMTASTQSILLLIGLSYIIYVVLVLIATHLNTEGKRYMPRKYWIGIIVCFSVIVAGLFLVGNLDFWLGDSEQFRTYLAACSLALIAVWLLLYFVFYFVSRFFSKSNEFDVLAIQNDLFERYILRKQVSDERIKILSHDLKHSLVGWRKLAEEKGDENALISIAEYERQLSSSLLINIENETANAIINQKAMEAEQAGVSFQVNGAFQPDMLVSKIDLCSLLGNLLDNAIEAAAQVKTEALRCVKLSIKRKGNLLILMVENGYAIEPVIENGVFATRKKDKDLHAIGTRSIQHVAEKYEGVVKNSYENKWFRSSVMVSGYPGVLSDEK